MGNPHQIPEVTVDGTSCFMIFTSLGLIMVIKLSMKYLLFCATKIEKIEHELIYKWKNYIY